MILERVVKNMGSEKLDETDQRLISEGGDIDPKQYVEFRDDIHVGAYQVKGFCCIILGTGPNRYSSDEGLGIYLVDKTENEELLYLLTWEYPSDNRRRTDFAIAEEEEMVKSLLKTLHENDEMNIIWRNDGEHSFIADTLIQGTKERFSEDRVQIGDETADEIEQDPEEWPLEDLPDELGRCDSSGREHNESDFYRTEDGNAVCALCGEYPGDS